MNPYEEMHKTNIDVALSKQMLQSLSSSDSSDTSCKNFEIPDIDGRQIVDFSGELCYQASKEQLLQLQEQFPELDFLAKYTAKSNAEIANLNRAEIAELGLLLSPYFGFGVLNGGSASSYFDNKKNQNFSPELFALFAKEFQDLASKFGSQPKALCPAFLQEGAYGPSFMGLKLRSLLTTIKQQKRLRQQRNISQATQQTPFFQMTSELTAEPLENYIHQGWKNDPADLVALSQELGWLPAEQIQSEKQALIATFTKNAKGSWDFFRNSKGHFLPMPGGHGQCFFTLRKLLQNFYQSGIRYISLGNIDNAAYNPQPLFIGLLALSGSDGFFVCSYRSSVDIKGGVLLRKLPEAKLNCYDIGVGVDKNILKAEKTLLFNCAIGYFNLKTLLDKMDYIIAQLPLRISEQHKDAGHYWQVEQITWEVMGLLDKVLVAAVPKQEYFLAAKLQLEAFVNTAYRLSEYQNSQPELAQLASHFAAGYANVLQRDCDLEFS